MQRKNILLEIDPELSLREQRNFISRGRPPKLDHAGAMR